MKENEEEIVAVYGTLMAHEANAHWAGDACRESATIKGDLYDTGYGFPAFVPETEMREDNFVEAELIYTDKEGLAQMDRLEGYPRLYRRERIWAHTMFGEILAWVYVMNRLPPRSKRIACGDWRVYRGTRGTYDWSAKKGLA